MLPGRPGDSGGSGLCGQAHLLRHRLHEGGRRGRCLRQGEPHRRDQRASDSGANDHSEPAGGEGELHGEESGDVHRVDPLLRGGGAGQPIQGRDPPGQDRRVALNDRACERAGAGRAGGASLPGVQDPSGVEGRVRQRAEERRHDRRLQHPNQAACRGRGERVVRHEDGERGQGMAGSLCPPRPRGPSPQEAIRRLHGLGGAALLPGRRRALLLALLLRPAAPRGPLPGGLAGQRPGASLLRGVRAAGVQQGQRGKRAAGEPRLHVPRREPELGE
eukprot:204569-Hanusia_phi.AAC.2